MIAIDQNKRRILKLATAGITILLLLLYLRSCSLDPTSGFDARYGISESDFYLAKDSRLPKWIQLPKGTDQNDIAVHLFYFLSKTKIAVSNIKTGKLIFSVEADQKHHPITEAESKTMKQGWPCPSYVVISVNGVEEVFEHAERGDIVHIVEPAQVTRAVYDDAMMKKRCATYKYSDGSEKR